jgi:hypothetical protein
MLSSIRRVVTGHDKKGAAVFVSDNIYETVVIPSGDAAMTTIWTTATVPADLNDETDGRVRDAGTTLKGGSVIRRGRYVALALLHPCIAQAVLIMELLSAALLNWN